VVRAKLATLQEIEQTWSINDLFDANAIITAFDAAEAEAAEKAANK
jgi:hypothetical protein